MKKITIKKPINKGTNTKQGGSLQIINDNPLSYLNNYKGNSLLLCHYGKVIKDPSINGSTIKLFNGHISNEIFMKVLKKVMKMKMKNNSNFIGYEYQFENCSVLIKDNKSWKVLPTQVLKNTQMFDDFCISECEQSELDNIRGKSNELEYDFSDSPIILKRETSTFINDKFSVSFSKYIELNIKITDNNPVNPMIFGCYQNPTKVNYNNTNTYYTISATANAEGMKTFLNLFK